jgi:type IV pilus assembly protein PilW
MTTACTSRIGMTERAPQHAAGFSLIELMVALTLGLMIVAAMLANLDASSASARTNARQAEYQTNGRYAADFLRREIQHAGFAGVSWTNLTELGATATTDYGCGAGFAANIAQPIWGANDSNPFSGSCIPTANYARGDILVLRRAGLDSIPTDDDAVGDQALFSAPNTCRAPSTWGPTRPANLQTPVADYLLETDVYYISPWTSSSTESPQIPALYRMTLGTGPAMSAQLIASGIENMQVQYGAQHGGGMRYYDASAVPATLWTNVVAVRLWLLARSTTLEPGNVSTAAYTMGDQTYPDRSATPSDGYQRQVFPLVVQIRK